MSELVGIAIREKSFAPMQELAEAEVTLEAGVARDSRGKPGKGQVTVVSEEAWRAACDTVGAEVPWTARRANLLVRGLDLAETKGRRLTVAGVVLEITEETDPCERMEEAQPGLRAALEPDWRGGVRCRVLAPGRVRVGDAVRLEDGD